MDMDPASVITLCKENIQPLRHGRNATQLGTALRAQEDVETHQLLMQEKQAYEDAIKNYDGDDPLEKWYEYILWVEQSYPKSGHESPIGKLLQQCLAAFEKETKYHQDRRYIRLWINYISMQKNPLELYQLIYSNGIGTMIADMYRAWAFELEQTDDNKRADEIYVLGIRAGAEPRDELEHAHQNFQLSVARRMLGRMEERNEYELSEQRQAFSSLRAIKSGRRVTNVRTGNRVRDYMPGVVAQSQQQQPSKSGVGNSKIQIYEDAPITVSTEPRGTSILDHVPIEDTVHKENTIKPGPWSQSSRKYPLIGSSIKPGFKIHEDLPNDNNYNMDKINLFPNHVCFYDGSAYPEHLTVPVFVGEAPSAIITKVHYPKDLVYANNIDRSIEEIKADNYIMLYNNHQQQQIIGHNLIQNEQQNNEISKFDEDKINNAKANEIERQRREQYEINQRLQAEAELQRQQQFQIEKQKLENERIEAEQREIERRQAEQQQQREIERQRIEQLELERQRSEQLELERQRVELELERQRNEEIERQRIEAERIEAERMEAELNRQQKLQSTNYMNHNSSVNLETNNVEHLLGQSLTVNTKEAMSVVQELWQSPINSSSSQLLSSPMPSIMPDARSKFSFDIHMDSSMTQQHAMSTTKQHHHHHHHQQQQHQQHHQQQQQQSSFNIQPYHDQENHQAYVSPYSSQDQLHHQSYRAIQDPCYQYQMPQQPHHSSQLQHQIQHVPQSHMIQQHHQQHQQQQQQHLHHQISQSSHIPPPPSSSSSQHYSPASSSHISLQSSPHDIHHGLIQQVPSQPPPSSLSLSSSSSSSPHQPVISPHMPPPQQQYHMYNNIQHMNNVRYQQQQQQQQQYTMMPPHQIEQPKQQLQYPPYMDPQVDTKQSYRMPELPLIKSPGMNRRDLKYLVNNDNKENSTGLVYNIGGIDDNNKQIEQQNNLLYDESLGISPLSSGGVNDTCFTEPIAAPQNSSTPMTFRQPLYRPKELSHYQEHHHQQQQQQQQINIPVTQISDVAAITNEQQQQQLQQQQQNDKLSVIMETTREYTSTSSGSGSSGHTRTPGFGFTSPPADDIVNKLTTNNNNDNNNDISVNIDSNKDIENNETSLTTNDQNLRAKIQAVHAQSPRTVQRNVDQITSEIRNNCDLRVPFKLDVDEKNNTINDNDDNNKVKNNNDNSLIADEPMDEVEEEEFQLPSGDINPFDKTIISGLLRKIKFPQPHHSDGYVRSNTILTKFSPSSSITLGNDQYDMEKCLGKGTYGTVMKAIHVQSNQTVALKTQRPAWVWEYYIAREIKARLTNPHMLRGYMDVTKAHVLNNASVLVSGFSKYGTLLSVTNQVKIATGKPLVEPLAIFFTIEMLQIVEHLHKCQIIHGDIKPDNFLLMHLPIEDFRPTIQLIDFGCSIDMSLFPEGTKFTQIIKTEDFTCIEMQTGRPWTYQTDLYCLAASAHCLLFGNYMRVNNTTGRWFVTSKMPRYIKKTAWEYFFTELLNIESCEKMPDLSKIRNTMEQALAEIPGVDTKYRTFSNVLNKR